MFVQTSQLGCPKSEMDPEKIAESLDLINRQLCEIKVEQSQITHRLQSVEELTSKTVFGSFQGAASGGLGHVESQGEKHENDSLHGPGINFKPNINKNPGPAPGRFPGGTTEDVQKSYEQIKDSLTKIVLPDELKVFDTKSGIARELQPAANILSRCSRYGETALKQLSKVVNKKENEEDIQLDDLHKIFVILQAQVSYLQGEYTALLVKSKFDDHTASLFRCFEKNQSSFSEDSLQNLRCAAEITAATQRFSRGRWTYRGDYRGGRGRGSRGFYQQDQSFHRDIPPRRWNTQGSNASQRQNQNTDD
jgi:hypothetical protein